MAKQKQALNVGQIDTLWSLPPGTLLGMAAQALGIKAKTLAATEEWQAFAAQAEKATAAVGVDEPEMQDPPVPDPDLLAGISIPTEWLSGKGEAVGEEPVEASKPAAAPTPASKPAPKPVSREEALERIFTAISEGATWEQGWTAVSDLSLSEVEEIRKDLLDKGWRNRTVLVRALKAYAEGADPRGWDKAFADLAASEAQVSDAAHWFATEAEGPEAVALIHRLAGLGEVPTCLQRRVKNAAATGEQPKADPTAKTQAPLGEEDLGQLGRILGAIAHKNSLSFEEAVERLKVEKPRLAARLTPEVTLELKHKQEYRNFGSQVSAAAREGQWLGRQLERLVTREGLTLGVALAKLKELKPELGDELLARLRAEALLPDPDMAELDSRLVRNPRQVLGSSLRSCANRRISLAAAFTELGLTTTEQSAVVTWLMHPSQLRTVSSFADNDELPGELQSWLVSTDPRRNPEQVKAECDKAEARKVEAKTKDRQARNARLSAWFSIACMVFGLIAMLVVISGGCR